MANYSKKWRLTQYGRAKTLLHRYNQKDIEYGRGQGDLTAEWIIKNIFSRPCAHCGETDWRKLGCNRLDNSKPHTMENCEPCCLKCNNRLAAAGKKESQSKRVDQIDSTTGEVLRQWASASEAARQLGYAISAIAKCANGGYFLKGKWYNSYIYKNSQWKNIMPQPLINQCLSSPM